MSWFVVVIFYKPHYHFFSFPYKFLKAMHNIISIKMLKKHQSGDVMIIQNPVKVIKINPNADLPFKENYKNAEWEVSVVSRSENRIEDIFQDVNTFNTGLIITPPHGCHIEVVDHPALYKAGYFMVGNPRVINPDNTEELVIPLYKFKECEDIELPFRAVTLVLRETQYSPITNVQIKTIPQQTYHHQPEFNDYATSVSRNTPVSKTGNTKKNNHMF